MDFSVISKREIIDGVKNAVSPNKQKKIYAQICLCTVEEIDQIIEEDLMANEWTQSDVDQLIKLIAQKKSYEEISVILVRSKNAVQQKVKDLKAKGLIPDKNKTKLADDPAVSDMVNRDLSDSNELDADDEQLLLMMEHEELKIKYNELMSDVLNGVLIIPRDKCKLQRALGIIEGISSVIDECGMLDFAVQQIDEVLEKEYTS